jgi:hypothetical protein
MDNVQNCDSYIDENLQSGLKFSGNAQNLKAPDCKVQFQSLEIEYRYVEFVDKR